jgi:glycine dehydrogenase subunit 2
VRHYTRLSQLNYSVDTHFYPLGSCTMKYNPRASNAAAMLPQFLSRHPDAPDSTGQGFLQCLHELQEMLKAVTGMAAVTLAPMAGAQGEFAGVAMIRAYHESRGGAARREILVPDAAHGTNPATAVMCGYAVREIATDSEGNVDLAALRAAVGPQTAGLMLTNPSTLGVFERRIVDIAEVVHAAGGLLYYDGANLNAILGKATPADMGFDAIHINLHKTFSTPHGGGGPGAGPVGVNARLAPFIPVPVVGHVEGLYRLLDESDLPSSIGRLGAHAGNAGVLLRAYVYARMLGARGMERVAEFSVLNANYLMHRLQDIGYEVAFPRRRASHEFIVTLRKLKEETGVTAMDVAKRLLDKGHHAPTTYFPMLVPECLLIEPTETESKQTLDAFVDAMREILEEAHRDPQLLRTAPHTTPVRRLDDVKAARELDLAWRPAGE